ncbi:Ig-like domain-containing protein [Mucilaginibacter frigoritolerans]|uniref:Ig-like domain-containing protein n=1 Tax=Mucilaginibacter frigoritolerans TaxID=652788 RepID=A0A562UCB2_9SPHI|nr:Ig-like domain-containing domain [Mucilaginibacter frigoritolerans]TWJ03480.1 Ig-like domain-containing protein [Mucilaginibacter frigoritolerans]
MLNKRVTFLAAIFCLFGLTLIIFGCANRQLPQGGPRDHDPPKLLKATPPNETRFFKAKVIQLDFDEFFKLTNTYTEITMSPAPAKTPDYKIKNKSLIITLKDSLEKNTTYVINFGKAIADVNESNLLKNFTYVFSTGAHIDSLSLSGKVINTVTGEREKEATVMLFTLKQDSTNFGKKRPTIFTTTDTAGNFSLNNLHPDTYRLYALKEKTPNKIYDKDDELIAFNTKDIHLTKDTENIQLKLFQQTPTKLRIDKKFDLDGKILFTFNKQLNNPSVKVTYPPGYDEQKIVDISKTKDTAIVFMKKMDFDSIRFAFFDNNKPLDTIYLRKGKKESFTRTLGFLYNTSNDKLRPNTDILIKANFPIDSFEPALINLKEDSTDISNFTVTKDTTDARVLRLNYRWHQVSNYTLILNADAVTDIYGDKNRRNLKRFTVDKPENYSLLTLTTTVPDTGKQYIVELLTDRGVKLRSDVITKNTSIIYKNYINGKYKVRVIYDANKNGKWDSGNVKQRIQPENIWVNETIITLRPNWDQVTPIVIPKEPVTP